MESLLVMTHLPDAETAHRLAKYLISEHLAACVNILPPCRSVYRWQGVLESTEEVPLLAKTSADRYPAVETAIRTLHPYDLPDIVAIRIDRGLPAYLAWIDAETRVDQTP